MEPRAVELRNYWRAVSAINEARRIESGSRVENDAIDDAVSELIGVAKHTGQVRLRAAALAAVRRESLRQARA